MARRARERSAALGRLRLCPLDAAPAVLMVSSGEESPPNHRTTDVEGGTVEPPRCRSGSSSESERRQRHSHHTHSTKEKRGKNRKYISPTSRLRAVVMLGGLVCTLCALGVLLRRLPCRSKVPQQLASPSAWDGRLRVWAAPRHCNWLDPMCERWHCLECGPCRRQQSALSSFQRTPVRTPVTTTLVYMCAQVAGAGAGRN